MEAEVLHKKKLLVPKLRFKGFDGGWKKQTLFDISENVSYGMNAAATEYDGIHKYIRITDIDVNTGEFKPDPLTSPLGAIDEKFKLKLGDIVFARTGASVGKSHLYNPKDGTLYFAGFLIKFSITKANPFFIYTLTLKEAYNKWVHIYSMRSGQPGLNAEEYKALKLNIPTLPEQQKIASFLSAIDEKIQQLTRKKELLELFKKGVMQQLFSGKLRFKDENGKAYPKWEKRKLGDVADVKRGAASQHLNYVSDETKGVRLLRINDFLSDGAVYVEATEEMKRYTVRTNDLLIAGTGATAGIIFIVPEKFNNLAFSYNAPRIRVTKSYHTFIYYYLKSDIILKQQKKLFVGNAQPFLDTDAMRGFKIDLPSIDEQQKIASYLSSLDAKIESMATQIAQSQTFKKGLLQQMFV
jgi:type I restriction enzyme, S subunit